MGDTTRTDKTTPQAGAPDVRDVDDTAPAPGKAGEPLRAVSDGDGRGLKIDRSFTRPGSHPYDELEWELRDAVLTNWRDGTVSFEQRGVEFPTSWSMMATQIVSQKYFRGTLGTPERERSVRQMIDRVADTITGWGIDGGYFADDDSAETFTAELKHLLVHQKAAFNSPVWFNVGVEPEPQCSACFILAVEDTMSSILNWYAEEGMIFKGGSGAGINLSTIRSSKENLKGGGEASGPVSFMRGADASAGTIKSGGKTRRAAKMVILNVDHPDVEEFVWTKAREEKKIRALREAGFDMDLDGEDYASIQYQNANNSVRVTDEFMRAYEEGTTYPLRAVTTGEVLDEKDAGDVMRQISQAAWESADPGMQFDTTINDWHTCPESGRINASNPCFPADALVHTDKGLIRFDELIDRVNAGEAFGVYTHDATNEESPAERVEVTTPEAFMLTGTNPVMRLTFSNGMQLRCTPNHRVWTTNRGYVEAQRLTPDDHVKVLNLPAPAVHAEWRLPVSSEVSHYQQKGDHAAVIRLPEKWDDDFAHYLGWLVGDGSVSGDIVSTIYGSDEDREHVLPRHQQLVTWMNGDREPTPSVQANGTVQLRQSRRAIRAFLQALGVTDANAADKRLPESIRQAPPEIAAAFLRGLFDADGCVSSTSKARYAGLGSRSLELLRDVQMMLTTFGIHARIEVSPDGSSVGYDLRISGRSIERFAEAVGFSLPAKQAALQPVLTEHVRYRTDETVRLIARIDDGYEQTYNLTEPRNHSYVVGGMVVRNCSEYMHLDNSACNLASLNLKKFYDYDAGRFDVEAFKRAIEIVFTAQEIVVGYSSYPTEQIGKNAVDYRELGLGYANLGGLLMSIGLPYDSDEGRAWCGAITALMTGHAYRTSAEIAKVTGPFNGYRKNEKPMLRVIGKHRAAVDEIDPRPVAKDLLDAARTSWDEALAVGTAHGFRNSQATVLAPTGCLVGGSLVTTDRGLVRLRSLGDPAGPQWQETSFKVDTDEGAREATQFYVNGSEAVVTVDTARGYRIQGTPTHRIKVVAPDGTWQWRRFGDIAAGERVPLRLGSLVGEPNRVTLPSLGESYWTGEHHAISPREVTPELAEFVGYFMGDGSLHARGLRLCVASADLDVVERLTILGKELFNLEAHVSDKTGYTEVAFHSVRLVEWWEAVGFAKLTPKPGHAGKGWHPYVPDAILHTNERAVYAGFVRGLFEADGTVTASCPHWSTTTLAFSHEVQTLLLALGYPTTRKLDRTGFGDSDLAVLRILNSSYHLRWLDEVGFISQRKNAAVTLKESQQSARQDHIPLPMGLVEELAPAGTRLRSSLLQGVRRGRASRTLVSELFELTGDQRLEHLLGFFYDEVASAELGDDELTYDLSVPDNVTYVANGFVSHNTIGLMMDCDTTGIEPDLGLVKMKKLVGGGSITIVNQTVPQALRHLGYTEEQVETVVAYIDENKTIHGAPALKPQHTKVFQCAMGDDAIHYYGHVKMMAAAQPFISGAISKCVVGETLISTEDGLVRIDSLYEDEEPDSFRDHVIKVASLDGMQKTDAFYYGGLRPVREVLLRSGHRVVGTPNHRLLVATDAGLQWKMLQDVSSGDYVAQRYGAELWSQIPARLTGFEPSPSYGSQKAVTLPTEMTSELAFLLGAFVSEGRIARSTWTATITNADHGVLHRVADAIESQFGVRARIVHPEDRCSYVAVASKTIVEFLAWLGCGEGSANKRIPDAVLRSPREMVLSFLQGLALDAYTAQMGSTPKWAICLDSKGLLDDLQAVLTNLGVVHSRITEHDTESLQPAHSTADVVPGITPEELYAYIPYRTKNERGEYLRREFSFLADARTKHVSRTTVERVAAIPGIELPDWVRQVVDDGLHFSPVVSVDDAGQREVYDISVPGTHAFVGNGIVNHNTVNLPEEATVEDVEQLHLDAWKLGIKAIAIYRDNCKVAQPLSVSKKEAVAGPAAEIASAVPMRRKPPKTRPSQTISFQVGDAKGYITAGEYPGDGLAEIFLKLGKQGSTLSGLLDAFAIAVSIGIQYGVPLESYVSKFMNMRFEPAGMTDDQEIRFATSLVDYVARKLAIEYLPYDQRAELGIYSVEERTRQLDEGYGDSEEQLPTAPPAQPAVSSEARPQYDDPSGIPVDHDAPLCFTCGIKMKRAGACHVCESCGSTSGCS